MLHMRRFFVCLMLCGFILGGIFFLRLSLLDPSPKLLPQFLPNANRFRPDKVCASTAVVLVNSAARNRQRRQVIRETWGHPKVTKALQMRVAFGVGSAADDASQRPVDWEAETFGDLFQVPMVDTYDGLTRKVIKFLQMVAGSCAIKPTFIVKVDDDMFVNIFALKELISSIEAQSSEAKLWCLVWNGMPVIRINHSKWSISKDQFNASTYPTYCSGSAYIFSHKVMEAILQQHLTRQDSVFPLEDVYITGILAKEAGLEHFQLGSRYAFESINHVDVGAGKTIFAHLGMNVEELSEELWHVVLNRRDTTRHSSAVGL